MTNANATLIPRYPVAGGCDSGWYRSFDTDYPCNGCHRCARTRAEPAWSVGAWVFSMATADARQALTGLRCLGQIGYAVAAAGRVGERVALGLREMSKSYYTIRKGSVVEVTARRGRNAPALGTTGIVFWMGVNSFGTTKVGLRVAGQSEPVWTTRNNVDVVAPSHPMVASLLAQDAAERATYRAARDAEKATESAARSLRQAADVGKGDVAKIAAGKFAGERGTVIWVGQSRDGSGLRCGVKRDCGQVEWLSTRDVELVSRKAPTRRRAS